MRSPMPRFLRSLTCASVLLLLFSSLALAAEGQEEDFEYMKRFSQVYKLVREAYVHEVSTEDLMNGAIKGMLQSLDPHSALMDPKEFTEFEEGSSGKFVGIGVELSTENGQVIVVSPIDDTPADKAGMKAGDAILTINGEPTMEMSGQEVVKKIRGPKGTEVKLMILHKDAKAPVELAIKRDVIPLLSVKSRYLEDGYLWVRLSRFSERTTEELLDALATARKKTTLKGIILDLRNNPGGLLDQAVDVSDLFLKDGVIVSMRGREGDSVREFKAKPQYSDVSEPMVVLVNSGSASAAEIVAGAMQDRNRAPLLGERTFGKGSVQNLFKMKDGSALKLTIALYYTPSGRSIQAEGIEPDFNVPFETPRDDATPKMPRLNVREQNLAGHLENGKDKKDEDKAKAEKIAKEVVDPEASNFLAKDNQLRMGLQMLKGLPRLHQIQF